MAEWIGKEQLSEGASTLRPSFVRQKVLAPAFESYNVIRASRSIRHHGGEETFVAS